MRTIEAIKRIFNAIVDLFSTIVLWILVWAGAVLSLIQAGHMSLAFILCISGIAWLYKSVRDSKLRGKKK